MKSEVTSELLLSQIQLIELKSYINNLLNKKLSQNHIVKLNLLFFQLKLKNTLLNMEKRINKEFFFALFFTHLNFWSFIFTLWLIYQLNLNDSEIYHMNK